MFWKNWKYLLMMMKMMTEGRALFDLVTYLNHFYVDFEPFSINYLLPLLFVILKAVLIN